MKYNKKKLFKQISKIKIAINITTTNSLEEYLKPFMKKNKRRHPI